jgi:hypothetical protein
MYALRQCTLAVTIGIDTILQSQGIFHLKLVAEHWDEQKHSKCHAQQTCNVDAFT